MKLLAIASLLFAAATAGAQPYLVKDINTSGSDSRSSSGPNEIVAIGSTLYFSARNAATGWELWKSDGTEAGTTLVRDIVEGADSSSPRSLTPVGGRLFFVAAERLRISDGTSEGTLKLNEVPTTPGFGVLNGKLFFAAGAQLWVSDGTREGTRALSDVAPSPLPWYPSESLFALLGDRLVFAVPGGVAVTDGTTAGTTILKSGLGSITRLLTAGGRTFIHTDKSELWVTDGSADGTRLLKPSFVADDLTPFGNGILFVGDGQRPWRSDGTPEGTSPILAIGSPAALVNPAKFAVLNGVAYFATYGYGLFWRTDGTSAGTYQVQGIVPPGSGDVLDIAVTLGKLWIVSRKYGEAMKLLTSDGTAAGTRIVGSFSRVGAIGTVVGGKAFFAADDGSVRGEELWSSDGTSDGTSMVANIAADIGSSSDPKILLASGNRILFMASDGSQTKMWASDGTAARTFALPITFTPETTAAYRGAFYFFRHNDPFLVRSDGTPEGTAVFFLYLPYYYLNTVAAAGPFLYFGCTNFPLYKTDGTAAGTLPWGDLPIGPAADFLGHLVTAGLAETDGVRPLMRFTAPRPHPTRFWIGGGTIYFLDGTESRLWKSNGTDVDTKPLVTPKLNGYEPFAAATTQIFFSAETADFGRELWRSDGTPEGTRMVMDIRRGAGSSDPGNFAVFDDKLLFTADDGVFGRELWISDGTEAGTRMVKDIAPLAASPGIYGLATANGLAYFAADDGIHGSELWQSDGTSAGTFLAADLQPGPESSRPSDLTAAANRLFFAAMTTAYGRELWALPLSSPAISIDDVRAPEPARSATLTISLSAAAAERVTAQWSSGTASGSIAFEPGETRKAIVVPFDADGALTGNRVLYVRLHDLHGATAAKRVAAILVEDAEVVADLETKLALDAGNVVANVTNHGPLVAHDAQLTLHQVGDPTRQVISLGDLQPGETRSTKVAGALAFGAFAIAFERDPNPANDGASMATNTNLRALRIALRPASPTAGSHASLDIADAPSSLVTLSSSDPSILPVPSGPLPPSTIDLVPRRAGNVFLTASDANGDARLQILILPAGAPPRWPAHLAAAVDIKSLLFGAPRTFTVAVQGPALDSDAIATGTVTISNGAQTLATLTLDASGTARTTIDSLPPAPYVITVAYSGDAHFLPESADLLMTVVAATPQITGFFRGITAGEMTIALTGAPAAVPTGTISVTHNGVTVIADAPLSDGRVVRAVTLPSADRSVTVRYSGDRNYAKTTKTITLVDLRGHAASR